MRLEDVSGKSSIIVTANLAEGWSPPGNHFGFYGFAHEKYLEDGQITVRVWVIASPAQSMRAQNGFPLDLQSMGSSPSKALAFRLFNGRLSLGAALGTVINSRRSDGSPGYYKEAVLLARHADVSYWLRFYAALNDEHPDLAEWSEADFQTGDEAGMPQVADIREMRASSIEDRLSRASLALDSLEERASALAKEFHAPPNGGSAAAHGNDVSPAALSEKTAQDLREQWFKEFERQAVAAIEKLREEATNSGRAFEESKQQLTSLAEAKVASLNQAATDAVASLEAAVRQLREEVSNSGRVFEESKQQLASLADAKLASLNQAAVDPAASLAAAVRQLREEVSNSGRAFEESKQQLVSLADAKLASLNQAGSDSVASLAAAVKQLREEVSNSGRAFEESKQQLASLAEAKLASLNQAATDPAASIAAAMAKLPEEVGNSVRAIAESKRELASLAEAKITLLNQVASNAVANVEAEQRRFRGQYENSRKGLAEVSTRRSPNQPPSVDDPGNSSKRRGVVAMLSLAAGLFLVMTVPPLGMYLSTPPPVQMHLQSEMPPDFPDRSPYWSVKRRAQEEETARAYWRAAASSLQSRYTFGSVMPADPLPEFQVDVQYAPTGDERAATETRTRYWEKLRAYWGQRRFWVANPPVNETWGERLRRVWEQIGAKLG
jgi:flagellar biosynthesis chaperone FliJ